MITFIVVVPFTPPKKRLRKREAFFILKTNYYRTDAIGIKGE